jgi:vacuolar-type H+-ATPase subunit B/Vma2
MDCLYLDLVTLSRALAFSTLYNSNTIECCILSRSKSTTAPKIATVHGKKMLLELTSSKDSKRGANAEELGKRS